MKKLGKGCLVVVGAFIVLAVQSELGDEGYPPAAASALKHDLDALKAEYGCQIVYQRERSVYALTDLGDLALLDSGGLSPIVLRPLEPGSQYVHT